MTNGLPLPPVGSTVHVRRTGQPTRIYEVVGNNKYRDSNGVVHGSEIFGPTHESISVVDPVTDAITTY